MVARIGLSIYLKGPGTDDGDYCCPSEQGCNRHDTEDDGALSRTLRSQLFGRNTAGEHFCDGNRGNEHEETPSHRPSSQPREIESEELLACDVDTHRQDREPR
ncbi:hypothetical protein ACTXI0_03825 [Arthrobacter rhombi]|uniref:hypothetical protein n=1 Tax=Arthrobacter rhombi TaxID=71253 RepID=UPI003FCFA08B